MRGIVCFSLFLAVGCNSASSPQYGITPEETRISIAGLKALCDNVSSVTIARDATICGQVVAHDLYGEFNRQIVIQDESGGITLALDKEHLSDEYPFGAWVEVRCNGLSLCDYGGKVELGATPGEYGCEAIPAGEIERYVRVMDFFDGFPPATSLRFDEIGFPQIDTRVRFDSVRFADSGKTWCDTDPETGRFLTTEREIIDRQGNRFPVRTLAGCLYAGETLPEGFGSIIGVIDYFGGKFSLRVTLRQVDFNP